MIRTFSRYLVLSLLAVGLLLPQASAAVAGLGLADGRVLVICTGDGLRVVRISDAGEPVEISQDVEICALLHAVDTAEKALPQADMQRLLYTSDLALPVPVQPAQGAYAQAQPRAPPSV